MIIGENDSDTEDPSPTQSTRADQEGSVDDTASTDRHVETPCKSQTHQPKVEKYEDSLLQTEEKQEEMEQINQQSENTIKKEKNKLCLSRTPISLPLRIC